MRPSFAPSDPRMLAPTVRGPVAPLRAAVRETLRAQGETPLWAERTLRCRRGELRALLRADSISWGWTWYVAVHVGVAPTLRVFRTVEDACDAGPEACHRAFHLACLDAPDLVAAWLDRGPLAWMAPRIRTADLAELLGAERAAVRAVGVLVAGHAAPVAPDCHAGRDGRSTVSRETTGARPQRP